MLTGTEGCPPAAAGWEARLRTGVLAEPLGARWPAHVLLRPDGYVAWAGVEPGLGLTRALRRWCGEPRTVAG
ncbi:hypothetical protein [Streptomyces sp. NWU339]|uniref:aromatic-ring hydroxylase C-terminal domain-containing protein n=1 Tax=Streptomyces sp. NWU339 TaxID=2185284 RepID=UPI0035C81A98